MALYYYLKQEAGTNPQKPTASFLKDRIFPKSIWRLFSIFFFSFGLGLLSWLAWPFLEWRVIYAPQFTDTEIKRPIPALKQTAQANETKRESTNFLYVRNWLPPEVSQATASGSTERYTLSIPKLKIADADTIIGGEDLSKGLIHYGGTALPGKNGTAVVFGHSVLPQFFSPKNYMAIFSTLHTLKKGDEIVVNFDGVEYTYRIFGFEIVDPQNTSFLEQKYDDAYLYLITCTPPGTYWKRLVVKARIKSV